MYFSFRGNSYEQTEGVAVGSPLSPVVADLYMEWFEKHAIDSSLLKPKLWKRFVDNTHIIWPHGKENLEKFKDHLNNQVGSIKLTMEVEARNSISFLDIHISKKNDGSISH